MKIRVLQYLSQFFLLVKNFKPVIILKLQGRWRPGIYADIPVPVLQVPAEEEGRPGGLPEVRGEGGG